MMNLVVDIGNTFVKLAVFEGDRLAEVLFDKNLNNELLFQIHSRYTIEKAIFASVRDSIEDEQLLKKYNFYQMSHKTAIPLVINYKTPETLGLDRIASTVGAYHTFSNENVLVIDMGTCITFDFVNSQNEYLGGAIAPGFEMRFKALSIFTGKLPLINFDKKKVNEIGKTTEESIISGVYLGMKHEIEGTINRYISQYESLKVVVTGGDLNLFDLEPKNRIFADEFIVLKGLNEIIKYNEEE
jgi:type III pantothenate kinase